MCSDGTETTKIEVRYENLSVEGCRFVGHRAHPSLYNVTFNAIEVHFIYVYNYILLIEAFHLKDISE